MSISRVLGLAWPYRSKTPMNAGGNTADVTGLQNAIITIDNVSTFVGASSPLSPIVGDRWADTTSEAFKLYTSVGWESLLKSGDVAFSARGFALKADAYKTTDAAVQVDKVTILSASNGFANAKVGQLAVVVNGGAAFCSGGSILVPQYDNFYSTIDAVGVSGSSITLHAACTTQPGGSTTVITGTDNRAFLSSLFSSIANDSIYGANVTTEVRFGRGGILIDCRGGAQASLAGLSNLLLTGSAKTIFYPVGASYVNGGRGTNSMRSTAFNLDNATDITMRGFVIDCAGIAATYSSGGFSLPQNKLDFSGHALGGRNATRIAILGCEIKSSPRAGAWFIDSTDVLIEDCNIHDWARNQPLYDDYIFVGGSGTAAHPLYGAGGFGVTRGIVRKCRFHDAPPQYALAVSWASKPIGQAPSGSAGADSCRIEDNWGLQVGQWASHLSGGTFWTIVDQNADPALTNYSYQTGVYNFAISGSISGLGWAAGNAVTIGTDNFTVYSVDPVNNVFTTTTASAQVHSPGDTVTNVTTSNSSTLGGIAPEGQAYTINRTGGYLGNTPSSPSWPVRGVISRNHSYRSGDNAIWIHGREMEVKDNIAESSGSIVEANDLWDSIICGNIGRDTAFQAIYVWKAHNSTAYNAGIWNVDVCHNRSYRPNASSSIDASLILGDTFVGSGSENNKGCNRVHCRKIRANWNTFEGSPGQGIYVGSLSVGMRSVVDGAIGSGSAILTSATAVFASTDVGADVLVYGAGVAGAILASTILTFTNPTTVVLATNASTTVTGATTVIGYVNSTCGSELIGNTIGNVGQNAAQTWGINLDCPQDAIRSCAGLLVRENRVFDTQPTKTSTHGVMIQGAYLKRVTFEDNDFSGVSTAAYTSQLSGSYSRCVRRRTTTPLNSVEDDIEIGEDFLSGTGANAVVGSTNWLISLSGSGSIAYVLTTDRPGVISLATGATNGSLAAVSFGNATNALRIDAAAFLDVVFAGVFPNTVDANSQFRVGFVDDPTAFATPPANGAYLENLAGDTNWWYVTRSGAAQTRTDSGVTATGGTNYNVRIRRYLDDTGTAVYGFSVNGSTEKVLNSTIVATGTGLCVAAQVNNTTGTNKVLRLDRADIRIHGIAKR